MHKLFFWLTVIAILGFGPAWAQPDDQSATHTEDLYRIQTLRAAPGKLQSLIELNQQLAEAGFYRAAGSPPPFIGRHSQGDHWDLILIHPMRSYADYYAADQLARRQAAQLKHASLLTQLAAVTAFREDVFAYGPSLARLTSQFADHDFLHIEIFHALAGKQAELLRQRKMENTYLKGVQRTVNEIFVMHAGGDADVMTIGFYPSLQAYAKPHSMAEEQRDQVARQAGFKSLDDISYYLRALIAAHHDTLASVVR